ncbi:hypothetical protein [uncultured Clostridium sp.]|uniref:hypothetical protein n=1 Tax=uncultured Clostridium sp. TaxID=59620 RepID=UPI00260BC4B1|nr:hypothetical protein [uncultured Clostridium sp.]
MAIIGTFSLGIMVGETKNQNKYEMPEEIDLVSIDRQAPDTMIAFKDRKGTIHFGFKH